MCGESCESYLGRSRLTPERATRKRSEKSAEAIVVPAGSGRRAEGKGERTTLSLEGTMHQKSGQLELPLEARGEAPCDRRSGEVPTAARGTERSGDDRLMERVVEGSNLLAALRRVRQNKGSPGVDGMTVEELPQYLGRHWEDLRAQLLQGAYQPKPVKRQAIPKRGGGSGSLGFPAFWTGSSSRPSCRCFNRDST